MSGQRITVEEYMQANNIKSRQTVYNRVQSGHLKSEKIDNRLYIILDNEIKESVQEDWTAEIIKNTVLDKDRQIEELKKRIESAEEEKKKAEERAEKEKEILNRRLDTAESEKKDFWKKLITYMRYEWLFTWNVWSHTKIQNFLSTNWYL